MDRIGGVADYEGLGRLEITERVLTRIGDVKEPVQSRELVIAHDRIINVGVLLTHPHLYARHRCYS